MALDTVDRETVTGWLSDFLSSTSTQRLGWICRMIRLPSSSSAQRFLDRTERLGDRAVRVRPRARIGVGDRDPAEGLSSDDPGLLGLGLPLRLPQQPWRVGVAVRPAIDGDRPDVALGVESGRAEGLVELILDVLLEDAERRR